MKRLIPVLLLLAAGSSIPAGAQMVTGRLVTSVLGWERIHGASDTGQVRGYENVQLAVAAGDLSFSTSFQASTDFTNPLTDDPRLRLFNAILQWKNIGGLADLLVGRQAVFGGVHYGSIDGARLRVRPMDGVEVMAYGGGLTPPSQRTDFFRNIEDNWQAGAHVQLYLVRDLRLGLSYMNRHREKSLFESFRYDAQLGMLPATIDYGSRANQYGSIDAAYGKGNLWLFGRADYDFNFERLSRAELAATYQALPELGFSLDLAHREPTIAWNSYFALLEASANQEAVLGVDYRLHPRVTLHGRFSAVMYDEENAFRVSLGASNKYASVMYTKDISYDGDLDGFNLQFTYPLLCGQLVPHVGAVYSSYALADNLERSSTWAAVAGAMYRPLRSLSFDVQGQYMTNRIFKSDIRAMARVNWHFSHVFGLHGQEDTK